MVVIDWPLLSGLGSSSTLSKNIVASRNSHRLRASNLVATGATGYHLHHPPCSNRFARCSPAFSPCGFQDTFHYGLNSRHPWRNHRTVWERILASICSRLGYMGLIYVRAYSTLTKKSEQSGTSLPFHHKLQLPQAQ